MPDPIQFQHQRPTPGFSPQERFSNDLQYRDTVYVFPVILHRNSVGENEESWASVPIPVRCSVQEQALNSEHTEPGSSGNRFARLFTRNENAFKWHDKVIFRGITMQIEQVTHRKDNFNGLPHHLEARARYLKEEGSVVTTQGV